MSPSIGIIALIATCCVHIDIASASSSPLKDLGTFPDILTVTKNSLKLGNGIIPTLYEVSLDLTTIVATSTSNVITGSVTISFPALQTASRDLTLKSGNLVVTSIKVVQPAETISPTTPKTGDELKFTIPDTVPVDKPFKLTIEYTIDLKNEGKGLSIGNYVSDITTSTSTPFYFANLEPTFARHFMPCYDEPMYRILLTLKITHLSTMKVLSSLVGVTGDIDSTKKLTTFSDMFSSAHAYGFFASDFTDTTVAPTLVNTVQQKIHAKLKSITAGEATHAASVADAILFKIKDYIGLTSIPFTKIDHIAADTPLNGIEAYGIITYNEAKILLSSTDINRESKKYEINEAIAFGLSHQFFGGVVTPEWWNFLWLSKGMSTLMSSYIMSKYQDDQEYIYRFHRNVQNVAFKFDKDILGGAKALNFDVESPNDIIDKYDVISYYKGASVLRMFQRALGEDVFAKGLKGYLEGSTKLTTSDILGDALRTAHNTDVTDTTKQIVVEAALTSWATKAGYPTIDVTKIATGFKLSQGSSTFMVPIKYITSVPTTPLTADSKANLWLSTTPSDIASTNQWILLNIDRDGYYKVNYDKPSRTALFDHLIGNETVKGGYDKFPVMNRMGFFDDFTFQLAQTNKANKLDDVYGVKLILAAKDEVNGHVWSQINETDLYFSRLAAGSSYYGSYRKFIEITLADKVKTVGFASKTSDTQNDRVVRAAIMAISCRNLNDDCLKAQLERVKSNDPSLTPQDICDGFRKMDAATYDAMNLETDTVNYKKYLPYFSCSLNEEFWKKLLTKITANTITQLSKSERRSMLENGMDVNAGLIKILDVVQQNIDAINTLIGSDEMLNLVTEMATRTTSKEVYDKFKEILTLLVTKTIITETAKTEIIAIADESMNWMNQNPALKDFFNRDEYKNQGASSFVISTVTILFCVIIKSFF